MGGGRGNVRHLRQRSGYLPCVQEIAVVRETPLLIMKSRAGPLLRISRRPTLAEGQVMRSGPLEPVRVCKRGKALHLVSKVNVIDIIIM